jgi:hypothetical protein
MCPGDITPADPDDNARTTGADGGTDNTTDNDELDLGPDGAPCLVCGQTVPGPRPALICPDCAAVMDGDTAPVPPRP